MGHARYQMPQTCEQGVQALTTMMALLYSALKQTFMRCSWISVCHCTCPASVSSPSRVQTNNGESSFTAEPSKPCLQDV